MIFNDFYRFVQVIKHFGCHKCSHIIFTSFFAEGQWKLKCLKDYMNFISSQCEMHTQPPVIWDLAVKYLWKPLSKCSWMDYSKFIEKCWRGIIVSRQLLIRSSRISWSASDSKDLYFALWFTIFYTRNLLESSRINMA